MARGNRTAAAHASSQDIRSMLRSRSGSGAPTWAGGTPQPAAPPISPAPDVDLSSDAGILAACQRVEMAPNGLGYSGAAGVNILAMSAEHEASPTFKKFRGYIGVRQTAGGQMEFVGITCFGPENAPTRQGSIEASGPELQTVIDKVNDKLDKKRRGRSSSSVYAPVPGTGPERLDSRHVTDAILQRIDK